MTAIRILGVDLAGPANASETAAVLYRVAAGRLDRVGARQGLDDDALAAWIAAEVPAGATLVAGLDAPLSYNPGGGDRPGDRELRRLLTDRGLAPGTVMPPTLTRMVYLTLRGVVVARSLAAMRPDCRIVEVHPAGALALRGAPVAAVRELKRSAAARKKLSAWLAAEGCGGLPAAPNDHALAAQAAALAAWDWSRGRERWVRRAEPPGHPFDYAC